ncbi:MAG: hypothetical protein ACPG8F_09305 [Flavobacteriaceae bacterium]
MKSFFYTLIGLFFLTSCVSVRFPAEIKVQVELPENMSEEQVERLIDKIPSNLGQRKVKTRIEISDDKGTTVKEEKTEENYNGNN